MRSIPSSRRNPYLSFVALVGVQEQGVYWQDAKGFMHLLPHTRGFSTTQAMNYIQHLSEVAVERDIASVNDHGTIIFGGYHYDPINRKVWIMNDIGNYIEVMDIPVKEERNLEDNIYKVLKDYYSNVRTIVTTTPPHGLDPILYSKSSWDCVWLTDATVVRMTQLLGQVGNLLTVDESYHAACARFPELYDYVSSVKEIHIHDDVYRETETPTNIISVLEDRVIIIKVR